MTIYTEAGGVHTSLASLFNYGGTACPPLSRNG